MLNVSFIKCGLAVLLALSPEPCALSLPATSSLVIYPLPSRPDSSPATSIGRSFSPLELYPQPQGLYPQPSRGLKEPCDGSFVIFKGTNSLVVRDFKSPSGGFRGGFELGGFSCSIGMTCALSSTLPCSIHWKKLFPPGGNGKGGE